MATVFAEFRDGNTPGATYTMQYDPKSDRLKGAYFRVVANETYEIECARVR